MILLSHKVLAKLSNNGIRHSIATVSDVQVKTVSADWVKESHQEWVKSLPDELINYGEGVILPRWLHEGGDCDNHAFSFFGYTGVCNALVSLEQDVAERSGLALGVCFYRAEYKEDNQRRGGHAINWFINHEGELQFFEPADAKVISLNDSERRSIWFAVCA